MIRVQQLYKQYRGAEAPALNGIDLEVPAGAILGLLGANGAGKTTLISILCGLQLRDSGTVEVNGQDPGKKGREIRRQISVVPQSLAFYPGLSVGENLSLFAALTPDCRPAQQQFAIESTGLGPYLDRGAARLSGGLQRRLNLAIGLLGDKPLLMLDEPTAGVDPESREFIVRRVQALARQGRTVIYTSHYLQEIELACDRIAILDQGRMLIEGAKSALLGEQDSLDALFLRLTRRATSA